MEGEKKGKVDRIWKAWFWGEKK